MGMQSVVLRVPHSEKGRASEVEMQDEFTLIYGYLRYASQIIEKGDGANSRTRLRTS
jgi:hypothetical protein